MVFFAIQWGLVVSALISSITAVRGVVKTQDTMAQFFGETFPVGLIFEWNTRMQFLSLLVIYALNIFVAVWCPLPVLGYMLAGGNLVRVVYVLSYAFSPEKLALMGMPSDAKMLKIICGLQVVLGLVIAGCTYLSSQNADYVAYADGLSAAAADADFGSFTYFVYVFCGIGILSRLPSIVKPRLGMARFMARGEEGLPADKGKLTVLEFTFGFQAINFFLTWSFLLVVLYYTPTIVPVAGFLAGVCLTFMPMMGGTIIDAQEMGFGYPQLIFFLSLIGVMFGASLLTLTGEYFD